MDAFCARAEKVVRRVMSEVAAQMRGMMEQVVAAGGKAAGIKGYRIAGKTGTAENLRKQAVMQPGKYIASFVGFVPADKPQYAMLIMLDTPQELTVRRFRRRYSAIHCGRSL